jgi:hypothetical protein
VHAFVRVDSAIFHDLQRKNKNGGKLNAFRFSISISLITNETFDFGFENGFFRFLPDIENRFVREFVVPSSNQFHFLKTISQTTMISENTVTNTSTAVLDTSFEDDSNHEEEVVVQDPDFKSSQKSIIKSGKFHI